MRSNNALAATCVYYVALFLFCAFCSQRRAGVLMQQLCIALEQLRILKNFIT